ncbi:sulfite exporter TauE/SafE family protein [Streptomyces sp. NA02950]|uniref:HoxN/HupN/NixA family nickel/cobalt transporter n=1 Tax=Streptomyces sp. NA02950 TaxID=2742137 RepID=UPI001591A5ED|nr:sulfite exporter TauE/SafE family protein [Streptomyces sp. NA02950]QKV95793.1 sulfite exporter TauE/SafE family protein [Streptomyces sp. NA02950]
MRFRVRRLVAAAGVLTGAAALVVLPAGSASAHPLGNFTVNRYDGLVVAPGQLRVDHVEDLAEIPSSQAKPEIDRNGDNALSAREVDTWAARRCASAARGAQLTVDGRAVPVRAAHTAGHTRRGQAGLPTLRVECRLTAALARDERTAVSYRPKDIGTGPGWREMTAQGDRMTLSGSDAPKDSASRRLTSYPKDQLSSPADQRSVTLRARPGGPALAASPSDEAAKGVASGVLPRGVDRWTEALTSMVARHDITFGFALTAFGTAVLLGAMHAMAPGHGKTMMAAAAAAGGRSALRDVVALGASVTVTHTMGVFALGLLVTAGSAAAPSVISWLGIASGVLVSAAGARLLRKALRRRRQLSPQYHHHGHDHEHGHSHSPTDDHEQGHTHDHAHPHDHAPTHTHAHTHTHDHGDGHSHTHELRPTLRGTLLLGFAGGLVPSPSAVIVLVGAAALGQAWFGFLLVLAYGLGLALTLTLAGFAVVRLGHRAAERLSARRTAAAGRGHRLLAALHRASPVGTAAVVLVLGCGLVLRGAATTLG